MKKAVLTRVNYSKEQTTGFMQFFDENDTLIFTCMTLELPWRDNMQGISCIPSGDYVCERLTSPKLGVSYDVKKVEGRSYILVHRGNFRHQIAGCILVGKFLKDINNDKILDVVHSVETVGTINSLVGRTFKLKIEGLFTKY
jgi:hypothetical protein